MDPIRSTILTIIREIKHAPELAITGDADLLAVAGLDSMEVIQFIARIEQRYAVSFGASPDDFTAIRSLDGLAAWVHARV